MLINFIQNALQYLLILATLLTFGVWTIGVRDYQFLRFYTLFVTVIILIITVIILLNYDTNLFVFEIQQIFVPALGEFFHRNFRVIPYFFIIGLSIDLEQVVFFASNYILNFNFFYLHYIIYYQPAIIFCFGVDKLTLLFLLLTTSVFPIVILTFWTETQRVRQVFFHILFLELCLLCTFTVLTFWGFYIFFELLLIPMMHLLLIWGSRQRKIKATMYFFLYTFAGSLLMLIALVLIYKNIGNSIFFYLQNISISENEQILLWFLSFWAFAIKIPMVPFHLWLPEAHAEAPTGGSIVLAAILLKLGVYGFIRILLPIFPLGMLYFRPLVITLALISICYTSLTLFRQIDIKRIIAYCSIAHMNGVILGFLTNTFEGFEGAYNLMIAHTFSSLGLFACAGILYSRFGTRIIHHYGGLVKIMPVFSFFYFIFILANFGFPITYNFIGEFLIILGVILTQNNFLIIGLVIGFITSVIYSIFLFTRTSFGELNLLYLRNAPTNDIIRFEICILGLTSIILIGLFFKPYYITILTPLM